MIHAFLLTDCFSVRPLSAVQAVLKLLFRRYLFRNGGRPFGNFLLALWHYIHCVYWNWYCGNFVLCNLFLSTSVNNNKQITIRIIQGGSDWPPSHTSSLPSCVTRFIVYKWCIKQTHSIVVLLLFITCGEDINRLLPLTSSFSFSSRVILLKMCEVLIMKVVLIKFSHPYLS